MSLDRDFQVWAEYREDSIEFTGDMSERCWDSIVNEIGASRTWYEKLVISLNKLNRIIHLKTVVALAVIVAAIIMMPRGIDMVKGFLSKSSPSNNPPVIAANDDDPDKKEPVIKNSAEDVDYINTKEVNIKLNGDSKNYTLYITKENLKTTEGNKPAKITLNLDGAESVFESTWNDGLHISAADFDKNDKDIDVYITEIGTDLGCKTYIYKFNGTVFYQYTSLSHFGNNFKYDEEGNIYYWLNDGQKKEFNKCYNYKTKQSSEITDENLKKLLNK